MEQRQTNDSSESLKGSIYQFYHVVKFCSSLREGQRIYIEKFGDITISHSAQIEIKKYSDALTDSHENLWKTLNNWLDDKFDVNHYNALILLTTQSYGVNSLLKGWNILSKDEKYKLLETIHSHSNHNFISSGKENKSHSLILMEKVLAKKHKGKLDTILGIFSILDSEPMLDKQYSELLETCAHGIIKEKKELYIQNLLGFIISPNITNGTSGWCITYEELEKQRVALTSEYCKGSVIFPKFHLRKSREEDYTNIDNKSNYVIKIEDISYTEVIESAKRCYISAKKTITDELSQGVYYQRFIDYDISILENFQNAYRRKKRTLANNCEIGHCQDFYDEIHYEPSIGIDGFSEVPKDFKNGVIHMHLDDEDKDLSWKF